MADLIRTFLHVCLTYYIINIAYSMALLLCLRLMAVLGTHVPILEEAWSTQPQRPVE